jgi:hypothetical protein
MGDWGNLEAWVTVLIGVFGLLFAQGVLPRNPKDSARIEQWRRKNGKLMTVLCPFVIAFGILRLCGAFK